MRALLLAAGEGTRLRPLTERMPKPMIPIAGKPILQHNIELLTRYGIRDIAINLHHCPEAVTKHFGDGSRFGVNITYSHEPQLLGTAGAVRKLESFFQPSPSRGGSGRGGASFLVIYGDNLLNCDLERLIAFHRERGGIGTIALHYREDVTHSGVVALDEHDKILRFVEKPSAYDIPSHWVNAGILVLESSVLKHIAPDAPSDFGRDILPRLLEQGERLYGYRLTGDECIRWIDTPADLERETQDHASRNTNYESPITNPYLEPKS